jgi:hypothetical protein
MDKETKIEMPKVGYYNILGTRWKQEQITRGQIDTLSALPGLDELKESIKTLRLEDGIEGLLERLLVIVHTNLDVAVVNLALKPDNRNIFWFLRNRFYSRWNKVNLKNPAFSLKTEEEMKVIRDFFYLNVSSILNASGLQNISDLTKMISERLIYLTPQDLKNQNTDSQGEIS